MNKDMYELVARIRDHYLGQQNSIQAIVDTAEKILGIGEKQVLEKYDTSKINWRKAEGPKGPYEKALKNENIDNSDFKALMSHLREKGTGIRLKDEGMWYWLFPEGDTIGRKPYEPKKKEETRTQTTVAPPPAKAEEGKKRKNVDDVKVLFPKDLEDMLIFEETEEYITIRPRQYLGSENFAKIAAITRESGGEYISAGKESHFRVPR